MSNQPTMSTVKMSELIDGAIRFSKFVFTKLRLAIVLMIACIGIAFLWSLIQKPKFEGKVSFILEEKSGGMGAGLSGLASQFGFDIGSLTGSAGLFAGDNILDILKSRTIIEKVLLSRVDSTSKKPTPTLADNYLTWGNLSVKCSYENTSLDKPNTRLQDSVLLLIYQKLIKKNLTVERINKKGSIIEVNTVSPNEAFSKLFTERLVLETIKMYVDIRTSVSSKNIRRLEIQSDSLMRLLNAKSYKSASLQILDANAAFKTTAVPVEVSQREKTVTYALYSEVMKNLEASKMALAGQTPVINLLDKAKYPLENKQISHLKLLLIGLGAGILIFGAFVFITYPRHDA